VGNLVNVGKRGWSRLMVAVMGTAASAVIVSAGPAEASTSVDCGYSSMWADSLNVVYEDDGSFKISLAPTAATRAMGPSDAGDAAITNELWHAVQACVPGLYGSLADSVYQQLQCHVWFGPAWFATGPTYDFESYHLALANPGLADYVASHCLNEEAGARVIPDDMYGNVA
jgi:hypothetical protein